MSYTHNMNAEYRDVALQAREEVSEGRKEFYKLFGAAGFSVVAAAACGGGSGSSITGGTAAPSNPTGDASPLSLQDYAGILASNARGWKYLSAFHEDYAYMNYGTTGSIPTSVLQELAAWHKDVAYSPAGPLSWQVSNAVIRADFAASIYGCVPQEMFCSFNTTDGMIKTITGIKWNAGDTVLLTNNEHAGGLGPLHMCANRFGFNLIEVNVPTGTSKGAGTGGYSEGTVGDYSTSPMVQRFEAAFQSVKAAGGKVRAIMISSPCYTLGWRLEENELCEWAWSKRGDSGVASNPDRPGENGILTIIDAAHIPGAMPIDLHTMGVDYYAGTGAKWQCGPGQTGYAYVRMGKKGDNRATVFQGRSYTTATTKDWANPNPMEPFYVCSSSSSFANPTPTTQGWRGYWNLQSGHDLGGAMAGVGNPNYPTLKIIYEVAKVWNSIGRVAIAKYNQSLAQYLRQKVALSGRMGLHSLGVDFQTPSGVVPTGRADETTFPRMLQTGLTLINPFSIGTDGKPDTNADLTAAQASAQAAASSAVLSRMTNEYGLVIRNIATKHQLRSNPNQSAKATQVSGQALPAEQKNNSQPLRISTHLYTTVEEVDRCVAGLETIL